MKFNQPACAKLAEQITDCILEVMVQEESLEEDSISKRTDRFDVMM